MSMKETVLEFVENYFNAKNQTCMTCRHLDRGPRHFDRLCRVIQGKAALTDCPALRDHLYPLKRS